MVPSMGTKLAKVNAATDPSAQQSNMPPPEFACTRGSFCDKMSKVGECFLSIQGASLIKAVK